LLQPHIHTAIELMFKQGKRTVLGCKFLALAVYTSKLQTTRKRPADTRLCNFLPNSLDASNALVDLTLRLTAVRVKRRPELTY